MTSNQWVLVVVIVVTIFSAWTLSFQLGDQGDVLTRLDIIERSLVALHQDNKELNLEKRKLNADNTNLRALLFKLQKNYESDKEELDKVKEELREMKFRLENAEDEILLLKGHPNSFHKVANEATTNESKSTNSDENETEDPERLATTSPSEKIQRVNVGKLRSSHKKAEHRKLGIQASVTKNKRLLAQGTNVETRTEPKISFSAHMNAHMYHLGDNQPFVFETVNNNEGGAYDSKSGMFVCPLTGTYFFTASILSHYQEQIWADLVVNGAVKSRLYAGGSSGVYGSGSNSLIIQCTEKDDVWVRHLSSRGTSVLGGLYSHFGGFLMWTNSTLYVSNTGVIVG